LTANHKENVFNITRKPINTIITFTTIFSFTI
jgi:hypothetical protein